jgi:hypothetical protein
MAHLAQTENLVCQPISITLCRRWLLKTVLGSKMKNNRVRILIFVSAIPVVLVCGLLLFSSMAEQSRNRHVSNVFFKLSVQIKIFHDNYGKYPLSLIDLKNYESKDKESSERFSEILQDMEDNRFTGLKFNYLPSTNEFKLSAGGPDVPPWGWLGRQFHQEQIYLNDE